MTVLSVRNVGISVRVNSGKAKHESQLLKWSKRNRRTRDRMRLRTVLAIAALMLGFVSTTARADWKQDCTRDIQRAMANLTIAWKHLNARRQFIADGPQYIHSLKDSKRCAPIWHAQIQSFKQEGTFVWWAQSAVIICEAGFRASRYHIDRARDPEVKGFWQRRQWRYQHCITAGQHASPL